MTAGNARLLESPELNQHLVQFYSEHDRALAGNVGRFLAEGLRCGEAGVAIATGEHLAEFAQHLEENGADPSTALRDGRLTFLDARQTLDAFVIDGVPDWRRFDLVLGGLVGRLRGSVGVRGLRAYGEMVGVLWRDGQSAAAITVEGFWNKLLETREFSLFCGYPIDIFGQDFTVATVDQILCAHSHLLPDDPGVELALNRAMTEVLGPRLGALRPLIKANYRPSWAAVPPVESVILWLRNNLSTTADEILNRAAAYYRRSQVQIQPEC